METSVSSKLFKNIFLNSCSPSTLSCDTVRMAILPLQEGPLKCALGNYLTFFVDYLISFTNLPTTLKIIYSCSCL